MPSASAIPVATSGLRFICRPSVVHLEERRRRWTYPLSSRLDETDAMVWCSTTCWCRGERDVNPSRCRDVQRPYNRTGCRT
jgi:hypothetical protein